MGVDVIVVGGGIGGLGVAALLARRGRNVLVLESHKLVGGRCSSFEKDGFKIPTYVHAFPRAEHGSHAELAKKIGEPIEWVKQDNAIMSLNGQEIEFSLSSLLKTLRGMHKAGVPWFELIRMGTCIAKDFLLHRREFEQRLEDEDIRSWLLRYTDNETIHALIACFATAALVIPYWEGSMAEFFPIMKEMLQTKGGGYPVEGCGGIADAYEKGLRKAGGEIRQARVKRIVVKENRVTGVELEDGETIEAPVVISNAGVKPTVLELVGEEHFSTEYLNRVRGLEYSMSSLAVQIALDKKITDLKFFTYIPSLDTLGYYKKLERGEVPAEITLWLTSPTNLIPSLAPDGKQLLCCMTPVPYWPDTDWKPWVDAFLKTIERFLPDLRQHTLWKRTVTPENIRLWSGKEGTCIGLAQRVGQSGRDRPSMRSPIEGLYFVGVDVGTGAVGVELAAKSALLCAEEVESATRAIRVGLSAKPLPKSQ
jgi:phytoene dehydrogenase-like protein